MYLDNFSWEEGGSADWVYSELAAILRVDHFDLRETFDLAVAIAHLPLYGGAHLVRFSPRLVSTGVPFDPLYALRVSRVVPGSGGADASRTGDLTAREIQSILLDGKSAPLYWANDWCGVAVTQENVIEYVQFFCQFVHADDGAFNTAVGVPDGIRDLPKGLRYQLMRPMRLEFDQAARGVEPNSPTSFRLRAPVSYGSALFEAIFRVLPNGFVEMIDDLPLSAKLPEGTFETPPLDAATLLLDEITRNTRWQTLWAGKSNALEVPDAREYSAWARRPEVEGIGADDLANPSDLELTSLAKLPQSFFPMTDIMRLRFCANGKIKSQVFLKQCLDPSLPSLWPVGRRLGNLLGLLQTGGARVALDLGSRRFSDFAAFVAAEILDLSALSYDEGEPAPEKVDVLVTRAFVSRDELPQSLRGRAPDSARTWIAKQRTLVLLVAAMDQVLLQQVRSETLAPDFIEEQRKLVNTTKPFFPRETWAFAPRFGVRTSTVPESKSTLFVECAGFPSCELEKDSALPPLEATEYETLPEEVVDRTAKYLFLRLRDEVDSFKLGLAALQHLKADHVPTLPKDWPQDSIFNNPVRDAMTETKSRALFVELTSSGPGANARLLALNVSFAESTSLIKLMSHATIASWTTPPPTRTTTIAPDLLPVISRSASGVSGGRERTSRAAYARSIDAPIVPTENFSLDALEQVIDQSGDLAIADKSIAEDVALGRLRAQRPVRLKSVSLRNCVLAGNLDLSNTTIDNDLTLDGVSLKNGVINLAGATIAGDVLLRGVVVEGPPKSPPHMIALNLERAVIKGRLRIVQCCFGGTLMLDFARISIFFHLWSTRVTTMSANRIFVERGSFVFFNYDMPGGDYAPFGLLAEGDVAITNATIQGNLYLGSVLISGDIDIANSTIHDEVHIGTAGTLSSVRALACATVSTRAITITSILVRDSLLFQDVDTKTIRLGAAASFTWQRRSYSRDLVVGGNIEVTHSRVDGPLNCHGVLSKQALRIVGSHLGSVVVEGMLAVRSDHDLGYGGNERRGPTHAPSDMGRIGLLVPSDFRHGLTVRECEIDAGIYLVACILGEDDASRPSLDLSGLTIGQHLDLWSGELCQLATTNQLIDGGQALPNFGGFDEIAEIWPVLWLHKTDPHFGKKMAAWKALLDDQSALSLTKSSAPGTLHPADEATRIHPPTSSQAVAVAGKQKGKTPLGSAPAEGEIRVRNIRVSHVSAGNVFTLVRGRAAIRQCSIMGDVRLRNARILANTTDLGTLAPLAADSPPPQRSVPGPEPTSTLADRPSFALDRCTVEGNVELSGLQVKARLGGLGNAVALSVTDTIVKRSVNLDVKEEDSEDGQARASLAGALELTDSRVGVLRMDGTIIEPPDTSPPTRFRADELARFIRAAGLKCEIVEFIHQLPGSAAARSTPGLDLTGASVKEWKLEAAQGSTNPLPRYDLAHSLMLLLDRTKYSPTVYQNIESFLYGAGYEAESKVVRRDFILRLRYEELRRALPQRDFSNIGAITGNEGHWRRAYRMTRICVSGANGLLDPTAGTASLASRWLRAGLLGAVVLLITLSSTLGIHQCIQGHFALGRLVGFRWLALYVPSALILISPEVRAYAKVLISLVNRVLSGNFTSAARVFSWWLLLFGASVVFFNNRHHLDLSASAKKTFLEGTVAEVNPAAAPAREIAEGICRTLAVWTWQNAALFTTRYMSPVAPDVYGEFDVDNDFDTSTQPGRAPGGKTRDLVDQRCERVGVHLPRPPAIATAQIVNPALLAVLIKVLSNILLTLFGATIASQVSRKPKE
jgi:hypothetical protein